MYQYKQESLKLLFRKSCVSHSSCYLYLSVMHHTPLLSLPFFLTPLPTPFEAPWLCQVVPKGAWHGGQRPSVLIRGVWHQEGSPLRCRAAPQCNNSPVCHQSRPSWLAGWRGRCGLPAVRQEEKGEGVQPEVEDALRHSEGGERKDRLRSYTNQCL